MSLNFSHHFPEENLYTAIEFANGYVDNDFPDKYFDGYGCNSLSLQSFNWESEKSHDHGICKTDDILDRLPADPFGMGIRTTFPPITGWFQDFEKDDIGKESYGFGLVDEVEKKIGDPHQRLKPGAGNAKIDEKSVLYDKLNALLVKTRLWNCGFVLEGDFEEFFCYMDNRLIRDLAEESRDCSGMFSDGEGDTPHDALFFALGYLALRDLLSVERVCKSLRDAVISDPLLWRSIHIDQPMSMRVTDDALVKLTSRAQGSLDCLSLVECMRITDNGLKRVLESNPKLTKLSVPGCLRLSVEGILFNLRALKSAGALGIKHLRIGGLLNLTDKQFEELKFLLGADNCKQMKAHKPKFYRGGQLYLSCDDDRAIDIETCPKCQKLRPVYDCPAENCQKKHHTAQLCRACTLCIARCIKCGCCIGNCDYEETFSLDFLCLDCLKQLLPCEDRPEEKDVSSSNYIFH